MIGVPLRPQCLPSGGRCTERPRFAAAFSSAGAFGSLSFASLIRGTWGAVSSAGAVARSVLASLRLSAPRVRVGARIVTAGGEDGKSVVPGVVGPVGVALF